MKDLLSRLALPWQSGPEHILNAWLDQIWRVNFEGLLNLLENERLRI